MTIVTKTGDGGWTSFRGKRIKKDNPIIEALGTLDELQAVMGELGLEGIQNDIYLIMSRKFDEKRINFLEKEIRALEKKLKPIDKFLIFKKQKAVHLNWVRTVVRRAERRVVALDKYEPVVKYLNRLSDFIYLLARKAEKK
jgi:cob(I)alamin adenosyltransferase